jgi:hypothetical protein
MVPIIYGHPNGEMYRKADRKQIVIGGVASGEAEWYCFKCMETYPQSDVPYNSWE